MGISLFFFSSYRTYIFGRFTFAVHGFVWSLIRSISTLYADRFLLWLGLEVDGRININRSTNGNYISSRNEKEGVNVPSINISFPPILPSLSFSNDDQSHDTAPLETAKIASIKVIIFTMGIILLLILVAVVIF